MKRVPIVLNTSNALRWLGSLYRSPAEAIKEHVSNAVDEHLKAQAREVAVEVCLISFTITKKTITIAYPYGMSKQEFHDALQRVADSAKKSLDDVNLIGRLGIGMFSCSQLSLRTPASWCSVPSSARTRRSSICFFSTITEGAPSRESGEDTKAALRGLARHDQVNTE